MESWPKEMDLLIDGSFSCRSAGIMQLLWHMAAVQLSSFNVHIMAGNMVSPPPEFMAIVDGLPSSACLAACWAADVYVSTCAEQYYKGLLALHHADDCQPPGECLAQH